MSTLLGPSLRLVLASLVTTSALAACTDEPEFDEPLTTFAAASPAEREAAIIAASLSGAYGGYALAMAEADAATGCPTVVRDERDSRVTFTAPAGGCRSATSGHTYHGVAVAVNAPTGGEGGAGSPAPASPMSRIFTDFRIEHAGGSLSLSGNILQTVAEPTGAYDLQLHPLVLGVDGAIVTVDHQVLECAVVPGGARTTCANSTGARGKLVDGSRFAIVVDMATSDDGESGFVELRGADTLRLDFVPRDAGGCQPYRIDGVVSGQLCER